MKTLVLTQIYKNTNSESEKLIMFRVNDYFFAEEHKQYEPFKAKSKIYIRTGDNTTREIFVKQSIREIEDMINGIEASES